MKFSQETKQSILKVMEYAKHNIVTAAMIRDISGGGPSPVSTDENFGLYIEGFRVVFCYEEQPVGLCTHLTIASKKLPSIPVAEKIMAEFGLSADIYDCLNVWVEQNVPTMLDGNVDAVNILQLCGEAV